MPEQKPIFVITRETYDHLKTPIHQLVARIYEERGEVKIIEE